MGKRAAVSSQLDQVEAGIEATESEERENRYAFYRNNKKGQWDPKPYNQRLLNLEEQAGRLYKQMAEIEGDPKLFEKAATHFNRAAWKASILDKPRKSYGLHRNAAQAYNEAAASLEQTIDYAKATPRGGQPVVDDEDRKEIKEGGEMIGRIVHQSSLETSASHSMEEAKRELRNAAIYRATEKMHPIKKWVVRKRNLRLYAISTLVLSFILFLSSGITGYSVAEEINNSLPIGGFLLLVVGAFFLLIILYRSYLANKSLK